jgi:hypothetical protein
MNWSKRPAPRVPYYLSAESMSAGRNCATNQRLHAEPSSDNVALEENGRRQLFRGQVSRPSGSTRSLRRSASRPMRPAFASNPSQRSLAAAHSLRVLYSFNSGLRDWILTRTVPAQIRPSARYDELHAIAYRRRSMRQTRVLRFARALSVSACHQILRPTDSPMASRARCARRFAVSDVAAPESKIAAVCRRLVGPPDTTRHSLA